MGTDFTDDIRQSFVVAKNEIKKFLVGKKIILFGILVLVLEALNLIVPFVWGDGFTLDGSPDPIYGAEALLGNITLFILIAAVLFTATSIVSEFEERTALVLFTKPIRKWAIYFGKLMASIIIMTCFMLALYLFTAIVCFATCSGVPGAFLASLGLAICGVIGASGMAILMSSIFQKGSTASIMTLVVLLLVLSIIGALISQYGNIETWWMLDEALGVIVNSMGVAHAVPAEPYIIFTFLSEEEIARAGVVMLVWGAVTSVAGFFLFKKRDF